MPSPVLLSSPHIDLICKIEAIPSTSATAGFCDPACVAQLKDSRKALQEDVQREEDFSKTIAEFRNQLKITKEAADDEAGAAPRLSPFLS